MSVQQPCHIQKTFHSSPLQTLAPTDVITSIPEFQGMEQETRLM